MVGGFTPQTWANAVYWVLASVVLSPLESQLLSSYQRTKGRRRLRESIPAVGTACEKTLWWRENNMTYLRNGKQVTEVFCYLWLIACLTNIKEFSSHTV